MSIHTVRRCGGFTALVILLAGCGKQNKFDPPPPPPVTVTNPEVRDVTVYRTFPGSLEGIAEVEIRARVGGVLEKCFFKDGQLVKQGDDLFLIEQEPFQAKLQAAQARFAEAEASKKLAIATLARIEQAASTNAVSKAEVDIARAEEATAQAAVKLAEADVADAKINLSYTEIKAPTAGRVSRALVDTGNLVGGVNPTLLTTIIDDTSIRAFFELNERVILPYLKERPRPGQEELEIEEGLELQLELTDGSIYDHKGAFDFIDNRIDEKTRTIRVRAVFPNPGGKLAAGMFARIGIPFRVENAVLVPTLAILRDLAGDFVWVVDDNNIVRRRSVEAGPTIGKERIIEDGLAGTDRVIIAGIQRAREGGEVKPETPAPSPEGKGETEAPGEQPDMPDQPKGPEAEAGE